MAHMAQWMFIIAFKNTDYFRNKKVLEIGSQDINGNNNELFTNCNVTRIDLGSGPNVDMVCHGADLDHPDESYDSIISTEAFEHDSRLDETLKNIVRLLRSGGIFVFTCAASKRQEHGTYGFDSTASPHTLDFYQNRSEAEVREIIDVDKIFVSHKFIDTGSDLQFWGIKR